MSLLYDNPLTPLAVSYLPLVDPGDTARCWRRETPAGAIQLDALGPAGLPHGPVARCILYWLNERARLQERSTVTLDAQLTLLMQQLCAVDAPTVHDQLERLCGTQLTTRVGLANGESVTGQTVWVEHVRRRECLGGGASQIVALELSPDYFA